MFNVTVVRGHVVWEGNIGLSPCSLRTCYTNTTKVESIPSYVINKHKGNLVNGPLDHVMAREILNPCD